MALVNGMGAYLADSWLATRVKIVSVPTLHHDSAGPTGEIPRRHEACW